MDKWLERVQREDRLGKIIDEMRERNREIRILLGMPPRSPEPHIEDLRDDVDRPAA